MSSSRRRFLKAGLLATMFAAIPLKNILGQSWKERDGNPGDGPSSAIQNNDPLANYSKATFLSYLNSVFQLRTAFTVVEVTLLKVDDMSAPKGGECFSLLFRGGSGKPLGQSIYEVDHPALGSFPLFLVPVGPDNNGAQGYLATINRLSYIDAINLGIPKSAAPKTTSAPATATPGPTTNTATDNLPTSSPTVTPVAPSPARPARKPIKKPSWKENDDDEFLIN
jgi:hypothetical protein